MRREKERIDEDREKRSDDDKERVMEKMRKSDDKEREGAAK